MADLVLGFPHYVAEVWPKEAGFQEKFFLECQALHNVFRHKGSGGGGERNYRGVDSFPYLAYLQVIRAEVVAPLGYAVGFVHNYVVDIEYVQVRLEKAGLEAFRAKVEELVVSVGGIVEGKVHFPASHAGVDCHGPYSAVLEVLDLVFHKGDEGSDHKCKAVFHEGGHLEADALAAAGWKDCKHVTAFQCIGDNLLLHRPE